MFLLIVGLPPHFYLTADCKRRKRRRRRRRRIWNCSTK